MRRLIGFKKKSAPSQITVTTGAGHGSTNTKIRRIETAHTNLGKAISVTHSATAGTSFKINESGIYAIEYTEQHNALFAAGISRNSAELTTSVGSLTASTLLGLSYNAADDGASVSWTGWLNAGDIIRPHTDAAPAATTIFVRFNITKVD